MSSEDMNEEKQQREVAVEALLVEKTSENGFKPQIVAFCCCY